MTSADDGGGFEPTHWCAPSELPGQYKSLLDPEAPLDKLEAFVSKELSHFWVVGFFWAVIALPTLVVLPFILFRWLKGELPSDQVIGNAITLFVLGIPTAILTRKLAVLGHRRRLRSHGRYREGMFVRRRELLFHISGRCVVVPRKSIRDLVYRQQKSPYGVLARVIAEDGVGQRRAFDLTCLDPLPCSVVDALKKWQVTGKWPGI